LSRNRIRYLKAQKIRKELEERRGAGMRFFDPFVPGGLFEVGPDPESDDRPFLLCRNDFPGFPGFDGEPKTFKEHVEDAAVRREAKKK